MSNSARVRARASSTASRTPAVCQVSPRVRLVCQSSGPRLAQGPARADGDPPLTGQGDELPQHDGRLDPLPEQLRQPARHRELDLAAPAVNPDPAEPVQLVVPATPLDLVPADVLPARRALRWTAPRGSRSPAGPPRPPRRGSAAHDRAPPASRPARRRERLEAGPGSATTRHFSEDGAYRHPLPAAGSRWSRRQVQDGVLWADAAQDLQPALLQPADPADRPPEPAGCGGKAQRLGVPEAVPQLQHAAGLGVEVTQQSPRPPAAADQVPRPARPAPR